MSNVIPAYFNQHFFDDLFIVIKQVGKDEAYLALLEGNCHPSFAKAAIKKVLREKGW